MISVRWQRLGSLYFAFQGVSCIAWWLMLALSPATRGQFLPASLQPAIMHALWPTDLAFVGVLSLIAAAGWRLNRAWATAVTWTLVGAVAYASALAIGLWLATGQAMLGGLLMIPPPIVTLLFAISMSRRNAEATR